MDTEQEANLGQILQSLGSAGYFRAKIQGLSVFDKIVGGMVWCISLCATNVDVDLLYSENSTIGQKIALTEKIVRVLPKLKCPFSLEPHQIQGLDSEHIYPVIKWLVNEANFVRSKLGDETVNFAVYQFGQQGWKFSHEMESMGNSGVLPLVKRSRKVYKRAVRMEHPAPERQNKGPAESSSEKNISKETERRESEDDLVVIVQGIDGKADLMYTSERNSDSTTAIGSKETAGQLAKELEMLESEEKHLEAEIARVRGKAEEMEENLQTKRQTIDQFDKAVQGVPKETFDQMRALLAERDEMKAAESAYKAQCREELALLERKIETMTNDDSSNEQNGHEEEELRRGEQKLLEIYAELSVLNGEIFKLSRRVEARPSQAEMAQYQQRFVELCNQMVSKHRETKRQYILHNTLVDVRQFIRKECDLLESIDRQKDLAMREEYADSLLENLQKIAKGVDESLDKQLCRKRTLQEQRDHLQEQLQMLLDKHRLYTKTVLEFQQECQRNELLRQALDEIGDN